MAEKTFKTKRKELSIMMECYRKEADWHEEHGNDNWATFFCDLWFSAWNELIGLKGPV